MMSGFFKKYGWLAHLFGLTLLALIVAGVIGDVIRAELFALPTVPSHLGSSAQLRGEPDHEGALGRVLPSTMATRTLIDRRVFNLAGPKPPPPPPPPPEPKEPETKPGVLEESELPIELLGTVVSGESDFTWATVRVNGNPRVARSGRSLLDGKATIVKIAPGHIVLREEGERFTFVRLDDEDEQAATKPPTTSARARNPNARVRPGRNGSGLRAGVSRSGPYAYRVDRKALSAELADAERVRQQARSVPSYSGTELPGVKRVGVRPGSPRRVRGIRSGDVIKSVNRRPQPRQDAASSLLRQVQGSSKVEVEILRRGRDKTLHYDVE
jgi:type II secretory pathway component PulC